MKGVLDLQRRGQQIGRIRLGQQVKAKSGKMRPERLDTFRITTQSRHTADAIAAAYGGTVREWQNEWEVITDRSELGVTVPPRDQVVSQAYEMWTKGGASRRCDSQHEQISNGPCLCPHATNPADQDEVDRCALERSNLASMNPPQACKLVTRISVMLPDLPGLGVFRLDTGSYYAGVEIGDAAQLMEMARDKGVFLPAILRIDHRQRVAGGETKKYPVPVLEVLATFRQIASGELEAGGIKAQLPPAPGEQPKAITAGTPDMSRPRNATPQTSGSSSADGPALTRDLVADPGPGQPPYRCEDIGCTDHPGDDLMDAADIAEMYAARARATTTGEAFLAVQAEAKDRGVLDEYVQPDPDEDTWEPLGDYLRELWREKAAQ